MERGPTIMEEKWQNLFHLREREREREERVSGEAIGKDVRECGCSKFCTLDINTSPLP